jgi:hypothetical protein
MVRSSPANTVGLKAQNSKQAHPTRDGAAVRLEWRSGLNSVSVRFNRTRQRSSARRPVLTDTYVSPDPLQFAQPFAR